MELFHFKHLEDSDDEEDLEYSEVLECMQRHKVGDGKGPKHANRWNKSHTFVGQKVMHKKSKKGQRGKKAVMLLEGVCTSWRVARASTPVFRVAWDNAATDAETDELSLSEMHEGITRYRTAVHSGVLKPTTTPILMTSPGTPESKGNPPSELAHPAQKTEWVREASKPLAVNSMDVDEEADGEDGDVHMEESEGPERTEDADVDMGAPACRSASSRTDFGGSGLAIEAAHPAIHDKHKDGQAEQSALMVYGGVLKMQPQPEPARELSKAVDVALVLQPGARDAAERDEINQLLAETAELPRTVRTLAAAVQVVTRDVLSTLPPAGLSCSSLSLLCVKHARDSFCSLSQDDQATVAYHSRERILNLFVRRPAASSPGWLVDLASASASTAGPVQTRAAPPSRLFAPTERPQLPDPKAIQQLRLTAAAQAMATSDCLSGLPAAALRAVASHLDIPSVVALGCTSKTLQLVCNDRYVWKTQCDQGGWSRGIQDRSLQLHFSWKELAVPRHSWHCGRCRESATNQIHLLANQRVCDKCLDAPGQDRPVSMLMTKTQTQHEALRRSGTPWLTEQGSDVQLFRASDVHKRGLRPDKIKWPLQLVLVEAGARGPGPGGSHGRAVPAQPTPKPGSRLAAVDLQARMRRLVLEQRALESSRLGAGGRFGARPNRRR